MGQEFNWGILLLRNLVKEPGRVCTPIKPREGFETPKPILVVAQMIDVLLIKWFSVTKIHNQQYQGQSRDQGRVHKIHQQQTVEEEDEETEEESEGGNEQCKEVSEEAMRGSKCKNVGRGTNPEARKRRATTLPLKPQDDPPERKRRPQL